MTADPSAALAAIRAREQAATPGPWGYPFPRKNRITTAAYIDVTEADWGGEGLREYSLGCTEDRNAWRAEDAEFIAHARDDVPRLVAALDAVLAFSVDDVARLLSDEWARVDPTSGPGQYPASYIATFADLARVVVAANCAAITDALGADR